MVHPPLFHLVHSPALGDFVDDASEQACADSNGLGVVDLSAYGDKVSSSTRSGGIEIGCEIWRGANRVGREKLSIVRPGGVQMESKRYLACEGAAPRDGCPPRRRHRPGAHGRTWPCAPQAH